MRSELARMNNKLESLNMKEKEGKEEIVGLKDELSRTKKREENMVVEREKGKRKIKSLEQQINQEKIERDSMENRIGELEGSLDSKKNGDAALAEYPRQ